jgi:hypothetical protein
LALATELTSTDWQELSVSGGLDLDVRLEETAGQETPHLTIELGSEELAVGQPAWGLNAVTRGKLKSVLPLDQQWSVESRLEGQLTVDGEWQRPPLTVQTFRLELPLGGSIVSPISPEWQLNIPSNQVLFEEKPLSLGGLVAHGSLATPETGRLHIGGVGVEIGSLGDFTGEIDVDRGRVRGSLSGSRLNVPNLLAFGSTLSGTGRTAWGSEGVADLTARLTEDEGTPRLTAELAFDNLGVSSPAGNMLGQNLRGTLGLETGLGAAPQRRVDLSVTAGETLWETIYLNLNKAPLRLGAELVQTAPEAFRDVDLEVDLEGFGHLSLGGELQRVGADWHHRGRLELADVHLGPVFRNLVRDPLAANQPVLAGIEMGGSAQLGLNFSGAGRDVDVHGRLQVRSGSLAREGQTPRLSDLNLDLPLAYSLGDRGKGENQPHEAAGWGNLSLQKVRFAGLEFSPLETPLALVPNRLYVGTELDLPLFGGQLSFSRIRVDQPLSPEFDATLSIEVKDLDLSQIPTGGVQLEGRLGGLLHPVNATRQRLTATGVLTGDLFGGRLQVAELMAIRPFTAGREVGAQVAASRMDLERLSAALKMGHVTGRVSADFRDLRVAYGQPVAFRLQVKSKRVKGVEQRVSLEAVDSISVVSTGSGLSGAGPSFVTSLFKDFPYKKIAFLCDLKNDVFTIRGLIRENDVEYLVRRPLLGGINVVNRNPDNRISFSDMLRRLKRLTQRDSEQ